MVLERFRTVHKILHELENIRFKLTTIGMLSNTHLSESYEAELMNRLVETEMLVDAIKECLSKEYSSPPFSSDVSKEV